MRAWHLTTMATMTLTACSGAVPGVTLECYADRCPVDEQLQVTLDVADRGLRSLDLDTLSLRIEWHADGELLVPREVVREHDEGTRGQTDPDRAEWVRVTSHGTLLHELAHVAIYRDAGFAADVQESQERHAGAYWTDGVTQLVERMVDEDRIERCGTLAYDRSEQSGELICAR